MSLNSTSSSLRSNKWLRISEVRGMSNPNGDVAESAHALDEQLEEHLVVTATEDNDGDVDMHAPEEGDIADGNPISTTVLAKVTEVNGDIEVDMPDMNIETDEEHERDVQVEVELDMEARPEPQRREEVMEKEDHVLGMELQVDHEPKISVQNNFLTKSKSMQSVRTIRTITEEPLDLEPINEEYEHPENLKPVTIACTNLNVFAMKKRKKYPILTNVSAVFRPGTVTALMGPSGAGKTTLMNVLLGRELALKIEKGSQVTINGEKFTTTKIQRVSTLVPQDDILLPMLTPRETLTFAVQLSLRGSHAQHSEIIHDILHLLGLQECADTIVGDADKKGLSGGQRKRVSIAVELIRNPSCLCLDEPTSGLDAKVALDVVQTIRKLADAGRTVICTIHQPSYEIFTMFQRLVLLSKGKVQFQGDVDNVTSYFTNLGYSVPQYKNPADHILNVVSVPEYDVDSFANSKMYVEFLEYAKSAELSAIEDSQTFVIDGHDHTSPRAIEKAFILFKRAVLNTYKDTRQMRVRVMQMFLLSLIIGLSYLQLARVQTAVFDRKGALLLATIFGAMSSVLSTVMALPEEKQVVLREFKNHLYSAESYFFSRAACYVLFQAFYLSIFSCVYYFLVGFHPSAKSFFVYLTTNFLLSSIAVIIGFMFGALFPTVQKASAITPLVMMPLLLFSGLLIAKENIPDYFIWIYYLSFLQYGYDIVVVNEFTNFIFDPCTADDLAVAGRCPFGTCLTPEEAAAGEIAGRCSGTLVLSSSGYDTDTIPLNYGILVGYFGVILLLAYFVVRRFLNGK